MPPTPPNFCFSVKASRYITHNRKLNDPQNAVDNFLAVIDKLSAD